MRIFMWLLQPGLARDAERLRKAIEEDTRTSRDIADMMRQPGMPDRRKRDLPVIVDRRQRA